MAVPLQADSDLHIGSERAVPARTSPVSHTGFAVAPFGERLLVLENAASDEPVTELNLVLGWFEELRRLSR
jgi:hypothetical protein